MTELKHHIFLHPSILSTFVDKNHMTVHEHTSIVCYVTINLTFLMRGVFYECILF